MYRTVYTILFVCLTFFLTAQDDSAEPTRKGKFVIETGYSAFNSFSTGSGLSILSDDGADATSLSFDAGTFLSENFAFGFSASYLESGGFDIFNLGASGKYYIGGTAPFEFGATMFDLFDDPDVLFDLAIGYAFVLADNIYFEPSLGLLFDTEGESVTQIGTSFVLLF